MGVKDGYVVESVIGENSADNDVDTSEVVGNEDGSLLERIEYLQTLLASLDTKTLETLIEAIQGTGFSTLTDSLKVLSDNIDLVKVETDKITNVALEATIGTPTDTDIATDISNVKAAIDAGFALTGDAEVANVLETKTFYKDNYQTKLTGTMSNNAGDVAAVSASMDGTTIKLVVAEGYTDGVDDASTIDLTTVDADLVTGNIKAGANILGVDGKTEVVDTTEAVDPATEADIALGKVAYVNGVKLTGTVV